MTSYPDCPFCQIDYQSLIHEDDKIIAVACQKGHQELYRIIYKYHCSLEELPQEEWDYMIEAAYALGKARVWRTKETYEVDETQDDFSHVSIKVGFK